MSECALEQKLTMMIILDMLLLCLLPQLEGHQPDMVFHQDGVPLQCSDTARGFLDVAFVLTRYCSTRLLPGGGGGTWTLFTRPPVTSLHEIKLRIVAAMKNITLKNAGEHLKGN